MARIELVIFDFDGTLVDTAPDLITATNLWLAARGLPPESDARIRSEIGMGLRKFLVDLFPADQLSPEEKRELDDEFTLIYEQNYLKTPRMFDGVERFLDAWPGRQAIVSNKRERFIHPLVERLGMDRWDWARVIGGDTFEVMKPHPKPFLAAMEAAGVTPEETLIVGDGEPDIEGAVALGCHSVAVGFGYAPIDVLMDLGAWRRIDHYDELMPLIRSIPGGLS
jgi:phosphoglycolate phosphatase